MHARFSPPYWKFCAYRLRAVSVREAIERRDGWRRHWHPFWVIDTWGSSRGWTRVRGQVYRRERNSVALYAPRTMYWEKHEAGQLLSAAWIMLEEIPGGDSPFQALTAETGAAQFEDPAGQICELVETLAGLSGTHTPGKTFLLQARVHQVIGTLLNLGLITLQPEGASRAPERQWIHPWKRRVRIELDRAFPKKFSLSHLAGKLGVSSSTLTHKYRRLCGESFRETVQQWRLEKARVLLEKKDFSLKEVSSRLGLSHPSYLTAFLKKTTGRSPSELRRILLPQDH